MLQTHYTSYLKVYQNFISFSTTETENVENEQLKEENGH